MSIDEMIASASEFKIAVGEDHKPTDNELNNLTYLSMKYLIGWGMRTVDFQIVKTMGGEPASMTEMKENFIPELAEYMWDHLMGEPEEPPVEELTRAITDAMVPFLFSQDEKTRNSIESE